MVGMLGFGELWVQMKWKIGRDMDMLDDVQLQ